MRAMRWLVAASAAAVFLGACSSAPSTDPERARAGPAAGGSIATTAPPPARDAIDPCVGLLAALGDVAALVPELAVSDDAASATERAHLHAATDALLAAVPTELHDDAAQLVGALTDYARRLDELRLVHAGPEALADADALLRAPEARRANDDLDAYVAAGCVR